MNELGALLAAFHEATGREAAVWERPQGANSARSLGASSAAFDSSTRSSAGDGDPAEGWRDFGLDARRIATGDGEGWLVTERSSTTGRDADALVERLVPVTRRLVRERDGATNELVDRYEEINLLYAIGELLGGTPSVESVADTLLRELAITVGATRAVFLLTRRESTSVRAVTTAAALVPIAALGIELGAYPTVSLDHESHIATRAYHGATTCVANAEEAEHSDPVLADGRSALLAVAITRPSTGIGMTGQFAVPTARGMIQRREDASSAVPLGVLVLATRPGASPFSAGDRKLATAVGTQIGIALHNASLVRSAMERQQLVRELRLAHELQLKLLPNPRVVGPEARAAARVLPAESVGGDFFLLARLDGDRTAVLMGDVAGHGYQAALVMALALSAAAIHVQAAFDPAIALDAVRRSLAEELTSTDMSLTLCYALIDARARELRYANAGHPHAFRVGKDGVCDRLVATVPPIGFSDAPIEDRMLPWRDDDRLVLFTDGIIDARDPAGARLGETPILDVLCATALTQSDATPAEILDAVFARVEAHAMGTPPLDDLAVVVVDRRGRPS